MVNRYLGADDERRTGPLKQVERRLNEILKQITNANVINNFTVPVRCVPRTHRLISVIGDHALQGCNGIKCVSINTKIRRKKMKMKLFKEAKPKTKEDSIQFVCP